MTIAVRPTARLRWWREVGLVVVLYLAYSFVRNRFGSASVGADRAYENAERVIAVERWMGLFHEASIQSFFGDWKPFFMFWNTFYGSLHFLVPIGVLAFLFRRFPQDYRRWRNAIILTTLLALVGFSVFPLMPPRLFCDCPHGAGPAAASYGFVDTLNRDGGLWTFESSPVAAVSNQYAAMPSLHVAWALWCALALYPRLRRRWARRLALAYPALTCFAVVVTGNHFWLDAVGGALVLGLGWLASGPVTGWTERARGDTTGEDPAGVLVERRTAGVP